MLVLGGGTCHQALHEEMERLCLDFGQRLFVLAINHTNPAIRSLARLGEVADGLGGDHGIFAVTAGNGRNDPISQLDQFRAIRNEIRTGGCLANETPSS